MLNPFCVSEANAGVGYSRISLMLHTLIHHPEGNCIPLLPGTV
jgi:hypothetical protein